MKRWIHADSRDDHEIASTTPRNQINFDHDVIWSVQFYDSGADLIYQKEIYVLAKTYASAREQADILCEAWGFHSDACVVQYAYKPITYWDRLRIEEQSGVIYGIYSTKG